MRTPPLLILLLVTLFALPSAWAGGDWQQPTGLALGFSVESQNVCPRVLVRERTKSSHDSYYFWFGSSSSESDREWERLDCTFSPSALRDAIVAGLIQANVTLLASDAQRKLLSASGSSGTKAGLQARTWAARDAGVELLVTGSLSDVGEKILLAIQVLSTKDGEVVAATTRVFPRMESLISAAAASTQEAISQARAARPGWWAPAPALVGQRLGELLELVDRDQRRPIEGRVVELTPDRRRAMVLAMHEGIATGGVVTGDDGAIGVVASSRGAEVVVDLNGAPVGAGALVELVPEVQPLRLRLGHVDRCGDKVIAALTAVVTEYQPATATGRESTVSVSTDCSALQLAVPGVDTWTLSF